MCGSKICQRPKTTKSEALSLAWIGQLFWPTILHVVSRREYGRAIFRKWPPILHCGMSKAMRRAQLQDASSKVKYHSVFLNSRKIRYNYVYLSDLFSCRTPQINGYAEISMTSVQPRRANFKEVWNYSLAQMIAEFGGNVGMFLGVSFLSIFRNNLFFG